jgi:hypothetical protein
VIVVATAGGLRRADGGISGLHRSESSLRAAEQLATWLATRHRWLDAELATNIVPVQVFATWTLLFLSAARRNWNDNFPLPNLRNYQWQPFIYDRSNLPKPKTQKVQHLEKLSLVHFFQSFW